jgi:hypothetical protein
MEPSEIFILSIVSIIIGIISYAINKSFNSKCSDCSCCFGLITIKRDIQKENEIEIEKMEHNINLNEDQNILNENINKIVMNNK